MARLTRFEVTRLLSARALQLSLGAPPLIKAGKVASMISIAEQEFVEKVIPLSVLRHYPNGKIKRIEDE